MAALLLSTLPLGQLGRGRALHRLRLAWAAVVAAGVVFSGWGAGPLALLVTAAVVQLRSRLRAVGTAAGRSRCGDSGVALG